MAKTPMATTSIFTSLAGMLTGAAGSYYSARSNKSSLQFQADIAEINARLSESAAQQELRRGQHEVGNLTRQAGQLKGKQRSRLAANGVDLGEGSAAELQASTDLMKQVDVAQIEENALRSAWGYRLQGSNYRSGARSGRASARSISPGLAAGTSLLGSAGTVAQQWYEL